MGFGQDLIICIPQKIGAFGFMKNRRELVGGGGLNS